MIQQKKEEYISSMISHLKSKNVLLIDDNIECTEVCANLLRNFVSEIHHAKSSSCALKIMKDKQIDFIVCDVFLDSEDNGLDLIQSIRTKNLHIPIIVISGFEDTDYLLKSIPLSLTAYLIKPVKHDLLMEALYECGRKLSRSPATTTIQLIKDDFFYDSFEKVIIKNGIVFKLNRKEIMFMEMVLHTNSVVITKDMFYEYVWEYNEMSDAALKNFILRLRKRFGKNFIESVNNFGYKI